jgi:hypothetical protein
MKKLRLSAVITAICLSLVFVAAAAAGTNRNFTTHLSGDEEVPNGPAVIDTNAQGQAIFHLSEDGNTLYYKLIVANIENVVASHLHLGVAGVNGPVVVFLFGSVPPGGGRFDGVLAEGTISDASTFTRPDLVSSLEDLLAAIAAGDIYVNVHTNDGVGPTNTGPGDFPGGEIRGQID